MERTMNLRYIIIIVIIWSSSSPDRRRRRRRLRYELIFLTSTTSENVLFIVYS